MAIAMPSARNMFGQLQNALKGAKNRIALNKGVHQALNNFC